MNTIFFPCYENNSGGPFQVHFTSAAGQQSHLPFQEASDNGNDAPRKVLDFQSILAAPPGHQTNISNMLTLFLSAIIFLPC